MLHASGALRAVVHMVRSVRKAFGGKPQTPASGSAVPVTGGLFTFSGGLS